MSAETTPPAPAAILKGLRGGPPCAPALGSVRVASNHQPLNAALRAGSAPRAKQYISNRALVAKHLAEPV